MFTDLAVTALENLDGMVSLVGWSISVGGMQAKSSLPVSSEKSAGSGGACMT